MKIGLSIDGVLRNLLGQIEETHKKYFFDENKEPIKVEDYDFEKWLTFPEEEVTQGEIEFDVNFNETDFLESENNINVIKKKTKTNLKEFLYEKCTVEIFGYADEVISSAVETLNQLILKNPEHEFILLSREGGLSVPSTLFFLAKTKSICQNIKFVNEYSKVWDNIDIMVTDHPNIINTKPKNKSLIIVNKDYNKNFIDFDYRINSIKELDNQIF